MAREVLKTSTVKKYQAVLLATGIMHLILASKPATMPSVARPGREKAKQSRGQGAALLHTCSYTLCANQGRVRAARREVSFFPSMVPV